MSSELTEFKRGHPLKPDDPEQPTSGAKFQFLLAGQSQVGRAQGNVRFTPESGHVQCNSACPLCANSGHRMKLFDHPVGTLL